MEVYLLRYGTSLRDTIVYSRHYWMLAGHCNLHFIMPAAADKELSRDHPQWRLRPGFDSDTVLEICPDDIGTRMT